MKAADKAWLGLAAGVLTYDLLAPEGQTLSEGADRYMLAHPWVTRAVAVALVLHVINAMPARVDLVHHLFTLLRKTAPVTSFEPPPGCAAPR